MNSDKYRYDENSGAVLINRSPELTKIVELEQKLSQVEKESLVIEHEVKEIHSIVDRLLELLERR